MHICRAVVVDKKRGSELVETVCIYSWYSYVHKSCYKSLAME